MQASNHSKIMKKTRREIMEILLKNKGEKSLQEIASDADCSYQTVFLIKRELVRLGGKVVLKQIRSKMSDEEIKELINSIK